MWVERSAGPVTAARQHAGRRAVTVFDIDLPPGIAFIRSLGRAAVPVIACSSRPFAAGRFRVTPAASGHVRRSTTRIGSSPGSSTSVVELAPNLARLGGLDRSTFARRSSDGAVSRDAVHPRTARGSAQTTHGRDVRASSRHTSATTARPDRRLMPAPIVTSAVLGWPIGRTGTVKALWRGRSGAGRSALGTSNICHTYLDGSSTREVTTGTSPLDWRAGAVRVPAVSVCGHVSLRVRPHRALSETTRHAQRSSE